MSKSATNLSQSEVSKALKSAGLQVTAQRLAVYRAVLASPHAMADDIFNACLLYTSDAADE